MGVYGYAGYAGAFATPPQYSKNNFIYNYYLAGNGGDSNWTQTATGGTLIFYGYQSSGMPPGPDYTVVHAWGNLKDINKNGTPEFFDSASYQNIVSKPDAFDIGIGVTLSARDAFTNVLRHVGARWWERDYDIALGNTNAINTIDERIVHEVVTGTGRVEAWADDPYDNDHNEGVEWRSLWALRADTNGVAPYNHPPGWDTDGDGMPDDWEGEHGLDPMVANNNDDFDADGYTDLEEYLQEIACWPAPAPIRFNGLTNSRYALIHNWEVSSATIFMNFSIVEPSSKWQPSRYDTALISGATVIVDAVGQHAGSLRVQDGGTLNITNGWLKVADTLEIGASSAATVSLAGGRLYAGRMNKGGSGAFNFTGGTLSADVVNFDLVNQGGAIAPGNSPGQTVVNGNLTLQTGSSLDFELGAANTNDSDNIVVNGDLNLGGTLDVTSLPGFGAGTYTLITYSGTLIGSLALGSMPDGFGYAIDTSTPNEIRLVVSDGLAAFETISLDGTNLVMTGTGPTNHVFQLMRSTDLSLPLSLWAPMDTNMFDSSGQFILTNGADFGELQTFYLLRLPEE